LRVDRGTAFCIELPATRRHCQMISHMPTADLVRLVSHGGGVLIEAAKRPVDELILIARAAGGSKARVTLRGIGGMPLDDLINIARHGMGSVSFE
jgi:hypothetical protein